MDYVVRPIDSVQHTRNSLKKLQFDSGETELDKYIKRFAWINHQEKRAARVFVASLKESPREIKGYYTSSSSEILIDALPEQLRRGFPQKIPAILIGRLAVDRSAQGLGIGKSLLRHVFECAVEISDKIGVYAVYTQAKNEKAKNYYKKRGFIEFNDQPLSLFLPIETIKQAIKQKI